MNEVVIDDSQREMCAVLVMRTMLTDYVHLTTCVRLEEIPLLRISLAKYNMSV